MSNSDKLTYYPAICSVLFREETSGWTGIIGRSPDLPEIHERLTGKDVYM